VVPLYEYQCGRCGRFEVIRKFSDAPLTICPTCGQEIQKLFSAPAIQFKGTGWYITDYARKSSGGEKGGEQGGDKGGEKSKDGEPSKAAPSIPAAGASKDGSKDKGASRSSSSGSSSSDTSSTSTKTAKSGSGSS
jgi:putative FmdB family regulatory protein